MKEFVHGLRATFLVKASALDCFLGIEHTERDGAPIARRRRVSNVCTRGELGSNLAVPVLDLDGPDSAART